MPKRRLREDGDRREVLVAGPPTETNQQLDGPLYEWQDELLRESSVKNADARKIIWYVDEVGGKGKSSFALHLSGLNKGFNSVPVGMKREDVFYAVTKFKDMNAVIFDIAKGDLPKLDYGMLGVLKNGWVRSRKHKDGLEPFRFDSPHVVVFANFPPHKEKMSMDRWDVRII